WFTANNRVPARSIRIEARAGSVQNTSRRTRFQELAVTAGKCLAIVLLLVVAPPGQQWLTVLADRFSQFMFGNRLVYAAGYAGAFVLTLVGLAIVPFLRNATLRTALGALIVVTFAADLLFLEIAGRHLNVARLHIVWEVRGTAPDMIPVYAPYFVRGSLWVL